jgi:hypothetical protein
LAAEKPGLENLITIAIYCSLPVPALMPKPFLGPWKRNIN